MKMKIYAVHDRAADAFMTPFFQASRGLALRSFCAAVEEEGPLAKHMMDYRLYEVGLWDDATGSVLPLEEIELVASGADYVKSE